MLAAVKKLHAAFARLGLPVGEIYNADRLLTSSYINDCFFNVGSNPMDTDLRNRLCRVWAGVKTKYEDGDYVDISCEDPRRMLGKKDQATLRRLSFDEASALADNPSELKEIVDLARHVTSASARRHLNKKNQANLRPRPETAEDAASAIMNALTPKQMKANEVLVKVHGHEVGLTHDGEVTYDGESTLMYTEDEIAAAAVVDLPYLKNFVKEVNTALSTYDTYRQLKLANDAIDHTEFFAETGAYHVLEGPLEILDTDFRIPRSEDELNQALEALSKRDKQTFVDELRDTLVWMVVMASAVVAYAAKQSQPAN